MSEVIIYTRPEDGGVSVVHPTGEVTIETLLEQVPQGAINVRVADVSDLPSDRTYREAWTDENPGTQVDVDLDRAKEIHMGRIRHARNEKLKEMDALQLRHLGSPSRLHEVEVEKQKLRDLPATFELAAENPDALKALWPTELQE